MYLIKINTSDKKNDWYLQDFEHKVLLTKDKNKALKFKTKLFAMRYINSHKDNEVLSKQYEIIKESVLKITAKEAVLCRISNKKYYTFLLQEHYKESEEHGRSTALYKAQEKEMQDLLELENKLTNFIITEIGTPAKRK